MTRQFRYILTALTLVFGTMAAAQAESELTANVALSSDYVWRGISQTDEDPAISGGFDFASDLFYAGVWVSNVDFNDGSDTNIEVDLYGGLASTLDNGVSWDVGVLSYNYPDSNNENLDFVEVYGGLGYTLASGVDISGKVSWEPDNRNVYLETAVGYALSDSFSIDAGLASYQFDGPGDYATWSLGGTYTAFGVDYGVHYIDTDIQASRLADGRVVLTVSKTM